MIHLLFILALALPTLHQEITKSPIEIIVTEFAQPLSEWLGFNRSAVQVARECKLDQLESQLLNFHTELADTGEDFTRKHIDVIRKVFKEQTYMRHFFKCVTEKSNTQNQFLKEKRKYKYLDQFIKEFPELAHEMFYVEDKPIDKGYRLGRFFRAFFEYYYQHVLHPAETASTKLIRAMTPKTDLFRHEDISPCLALQTSGKISQNLQNLGIHNIYINVPQVFNALKYMKFQQKCKTEKYLTMLKQIHTKLQKIDMFKVMYHEYNPWVEIAAEKYGNKQIDSVANIFSRIANNLEHYYELSQLEEM